MIPFKFFQKRTQPSNNTYLSLNMDEVLIHVLIYKRFFNHNIIGVSTPFYAVNVPIDGYMEILNWRSQDMTIPHMIEIDYYVFDEGNERQYPFTFKMASDEFLSKFN
jgi:hypothetical protein